jgi:hypothetical protein
MASRDKIHFTIDRKDSIDHEEAAMNHETHKEVLGATRETLVLDDAVAKRVVRKYDYRILPLFLLINLFRQVKRVYWPESTADSPLVSSTE